MKQPTTKIRQMNIESGRRILITSDIHGHLSYLKNALEKARFSEEDILIIVGDMVEKGPDSLGTLRYVMELCDRGNVIPLIGNVDASRLRVIEALSDADAEVFYNYILSLRAWNGSSFYDELARECGYEINSSKDILGCKDDIIGHFQKEFDFLAELPTVVETQKYIFVHGGLAAKNPMDNQDKGLFELTKYDNFMLRTSHAFDKYVVVGHWPVSLYNDKIQQLNPVINRDKKIISIDGGCGIKNEAQLNVLVIPDINCDIDDVSYVSYDDLPEIRALSSQESGADSAHIFWTIREIEILEPGAEFSYIEHKHSGRRMYIPNSYLINDNECNDYTDYELPVDAGDILSLITETSKGVIVKRQGVVGWYYGKYEHMENKHEN